MIFRKVVSKYLVAEVKALPLASIVEYGVSFKTGQAVTLKFVRNTESSKKFNIPAERFQQNIEPAGRYMVHNPNPGDLPNGWESGEATFKNPLVIKFNSSGQFAFDGNSWKAALHERYSKTGKALTNALVKDGYDGIVTVMDGTHEIVQLRGQGVNAHLQPADIVRQSTPFTCGPASLLMAMRDLGDRGMTEKRLMVLMGSRPKIGTSPEQMVEAAQELGYDVEWGVDGTLTLVAQYLERDLPIIVLWEDEGTAHYSPFAGIGREKVVLADPDTGKMLEMKKEEFEANWWGRGRTGWWMAILRRRL